MRQPGRTVAWFWVSILIFWFTITWIGVSQDGPAGQQGSGNVNQPDIPQSFGRVPLYFEVNHGQTDAEVQFLARGRASTLFLTADETVLTLRKPRPRANANSSFAARRSAKRMAERGPMQFSVLRMRLVGANAKPNLKGLEPLEGTVNYFHGNDPSQWRTNIPTFAKVKYENVYPGVDAVYYGNQGELEYDFVVAPGGDPKKIRFTWDGAQSLDLDDNGNLRLHLADGAVRWRKPTIYQEIDGKRREVAGRFTLGPGGSVNFDVAEYDSNVPLVIDPALMYATYLGGTSDDSVAGIAVDNSGNTYVAGDTASNDFPKKNANQGNFGAPSEAFITKLGPTGTNLVFSTYLGGNNTDQGTAVAIDTNNNVYVVGFTDSSNFPTPNGYESGPQGSGDGFVAKLNSSGASLLYASYLGGSNGDVANGVTADAAGRMYVTGEADSSDFPTKGGFATVYRGGFSDAFVAKFNPGVSGNSSLLYSTFLGGDDSEIGQGIAVDISSNAYVTGYTYSTNFPTTTAAIQTNLQVFFVDAFVTRVNPAVTGMPSLVYSTYLGGYDAENFGSPGAIAVDVGGNAYVTGCTGSTNFPVTANAFQPTNMLGSTSVYVTKLGPQGTNILYSTYLGGSIEDAGQGIAVLNSSNVFVTGFTSSEDFPISSGAFQSALAGGGTDAFVARLNPNMAGTAALTYSTFLGGIGDDQGNAIAVDTNGNAYVGGETSTNGFPVTSGAVQTNWADLTEGFIAKIVSSTELGITVSESPNPVVLGGSLTYSLLITNVGELAGTSVTVTDSLPAGVAFVSANPSTGSCSQAGSLITCSLGSLATGAGASISIVGNATSPGLATNIATVSAAQLDSVTNNNRAAVVTTIGSIVSISATLSNAFEAGPLLGKFRISRTGITQPALTVFYTISGTATPGVDYAALPGSATMGAGLTAVILDVIPFNDTLVECAESVVLTLSPDPTYALGSPKSDVVTINDNDVPAVSIITTQPNASETGPTNGIFTVSHNGCPTNALTVNYSVTGSASNGVDYTTLTRTVMIPAGTNAAPITVHPTNDSVLECPESVSVSLVATNGTYVLGSATNATLTIFDNDLPTVKIGATSPNASENGTPGAFTVYRNGCTVSPLTVRYSTGGIANNGLDYSQLPGSVVIPVGTTNASFTVSPFADGLTEGNETVIATVTADPSYTVGSPNNGTVTISDNVSAPTAQFTGSPTNAAVPFTTVFTDNSIGSVSDRVWDFGDGTVTNLTVPNSGISHDYTVSGIYTVSLAVNGPLGTDMLTRPNYIVAIDVPPQLSVSPTNANFGTLTVGQTNTQTFIIINTGGGILSGTAVAAAPFVVTAGSPYNIVAGQSNTVSVSFIPTLAGTFNASLTFNSNGGSSTNPLTGVALSAGMIQATPSIIDFGAVATGATLQAAMVVTNVGATAVTNGLATITGGPFAIVSGSTFSLAGFGKTNVLVSFTPPNTNAFNNSIVFASANGGTVTNTLIGRGAIVPVASFNASPTSGVIPLTPTFTDTSTGTITNRSWNFGDGTTLNTNATSFSHTYLVGGTYTVRLIASGPVGVSTNIQNNLISALKPAQLVISPMSRDFGSVVIGHTNTLSFSVINAGDLTLSGTATAAAPYVVASGSPFTLAGNQTGTVQVSFVPVTTGTFNTNIIFNSDGGVSTNNLAGVGLAPGQIGVSPVTLNFGPIVTGSTSQQVFTVTNSGGSTVSNGTATVSGGPYSIVSGSPFTLTAGASTNVVVQFAPVVAGGFTNSVIFATTSSGNSTNTVLGIGAVVPIANFSAAPTNGLVPLTVTFTDTSTGTITNRAWSFGDGATLNTNATSLTHTYTVAGTNTVRLIVSGFVGVSTNTQPNLIRVINPPQQVVSPAGLDFGGVTVGRTNTLAFSVFNAGDQTLNGSASAAAPYAVSGGSPYTVLPGQTGTVSVSFMPITTGTFIGSVAFNSNGGNSTNTLAGAGVTEGQIGVSPVVLNFGTIATGTFSQAVFTVTNGGGTAITNGVATATGGPYSVVAGASFSIASGGSTNVTVRFSPVSAGGFTNSIVFTTANGGNSTNTVTGTGAVVPVANFSGSPTNGAVPFVVTFTDSSTGTITNRSWSFGDGATLNTNATGVTHSYTVAGTNTVRLIVSGPVGVSTNTKPNYIVAVNPPQLVVSPASGDFGAVTISQTNTLPFSVINPGDQTLTGTAAAPAPFGVTAGSPFSVPPGQTSVVTVSFMPVAAGSFNADLTFASNGGTSTNALAGIGQTPGQIGVSPAVLNFGTRATGTTSQLVFTVTNGGGTLVSNGVAAVNGGPYSIVSGGTFALAASASTNVVVQFAPVAAGAFTNSVIISTANGGNSTNTVLGSGAVVPVANFSATPTNGVVPLSVTFSDSSGGTITNRAWSFGDGATTNTISTNVTHNYTVAGTNTVRLIVSGPVGVSTNTKPNLVIVVNPPQLVVDPSELDYGGVTVGNTSTLSFSTINTGDLTLNGTAEAAAPFAVSGGSPYSVPPGQTGMVMVSFTPVATGPTNGNVVFASNGGASTNNLVGAGLTPGQIGVSPVVLNFGIVATATTSQRVFVVSNGGGTAVSNGVATVTGGPYSIVSGTTFDVGAGGSTNVVVQFAPVAAGGFTNSVIFSTDNGGSSTNTVAGTGADVPVAGFSAAPTNGVVPFAVTFTDTSTGTITNRTWNFGDGATLSSNATSVMHTYSVAGTNTVRLIASGPVGVSTNSQTDLIIGINPPHLVVSPDSRDFGAVTIGATNTMGFFVINHGDLPLDGTASAPAPFEVSSGSPFSVGPGQSNAVQVSFIPVASGTFNATVIFDSNGGASTNDIVGTGLTPGQIGVSPVALNYGTLATGTTSQQVFVINNGGGTDVTNGVAAVTGGPYSVVSGATFDAPAGGTTNVVVQFAPVTTGGFTNSVVFTTDNGGSSTNAVTGTGAAVPAANFTATPTNGVVPFLVTFSDISTGTITNRAWSFGDGASTNTTSTNVTHNYSVAGSNTVRLIVTGPVGVSTNIQPNFIVGINPAQLVVEPSSLNFGTVTIGQSNLLPYAVINPGDVTLNGTASGAAPFAVTAGSPYAVLPHGTGTVTVAFSPVAAGPFSTNVAFASNGGASTNAVSGTGLTPGQIGIAPASFDFGTVATGAISQRVFVVTNFGGTTVSNGTATVSGGPYTVVSGNTFALTAGASSNVVVRFAPVAAGGFTNNVIFTTANGGNSTNGLTGTGAVVPVANFTATPTNGVVPFLVTFTDSSTGTITNRSWNFGDGATLNTNATSVTHSYSLAGNYNVRLIVSGPVGISTNLQPNLIIGVNQAHLVVNPSSRNFGPVTVGLTNTLTFDVINTGDVTLNGTAAAPAPFSVSSGSPYAVGGGQTGTVSASFVPLTAGTFNADVVFSSNGGASTNVLTGVGLTPGQIVVGPVALDFDTVATGSVSQRVFTVSNIGGTMVTNGAATVMGGPYSIVSGSPFALAAGASTNVGVRFAPVAAGGFTNAVVFTTANGGNATNTVTGTGAIVPVATFIAIPTNGVVPFAVMFTDNSIGTITNRSWSFGDGTSLSTNAVSVTHDYTTAGTNTVRLIVSGPVGVSTNTQANLIVGINPAQLSVNPASRNFGSVTMGLTNTLTFAVVNTGDVTLNGTASALAPFSVTSGSPYTVLPGQTGTVGVSFMPVAAGSFNGNVNFSSDGGVSTNALTGVGLTPGQIFLTPAGLDFGTVATGTNSQRVFIVTNLGQTTVTNGAAAVTGGPYSILSGSAFSLVGSASSNVVVRFAPVAAGGFTNAVVFTSANGGNSTNAITGTGAIVPVANFIAAPTNGVVPFTVTFTDTSTGTITNRSWTFGDGTTITTLATSLTHTYTLAGANTVRLIAAGPVGVSTNTQANLIVGVNPAQLAVSPAGRNFGSVTIGLTNILTFAVINAGDVTLNGSATVNPPFNISGGSPFTVAGGQTATVAVSFLPVTPATFNDNVMFTSNGGGSTNSVSGVGLTPGQIGVTPAALDFGVIATGTTSQRVFIVTNSGGTTVTNGTAVVTGGPFAVLSGGTFTLLGGASTNVVVEFAPGAVDGFTNAVAFDSANGGTSTNTLSGSGAIVPNASFNSAPVNGAAPLDVAFTDTSTGTITNRFWSFGDGSTLNTNVTSLTHTYAVAGTNTVLLIASGPLGANTNTQTDLIVVVNPPHLEVTPPNLDFASVTMGQAGIQSFTVINTGDLPLNGTATVSAPFSIVSGSPYVVAAGQMTTVMVAFTPVAPGLFSDNVVFASNGGVLTNGVTGIGLTPGRIVVSPAAVDYGTIPVKASLQGVFTVSNAGGTDVSNGLAMVTGGPFEVVSGSSFDLAAGASVNAIVSFTPVTVGSFTNTVLFSTANGSSSTNTVIGGAAFVPVADFSASPTDGLAPLAVTFTDASTGTIDGRLWNFGDGSTSTQTSPVHTYNTAGIFTVSLSAFGPAGTNTITKANLITVIDPNLFARLAGSFYGLSLANPPTFGNSGMVSIKLKTTGAFTGTMTQGGLRSKFSGQFDQLGNVMTTAGSLTMALHLDGGGSEQITGTVGGPGFTASLLANRAVFGKTGPSPLDNHVFTVLLPADTTNTMSTVPQGDGFGVVTIKSGGKVGASGMTGDGQKFKAKSFVSKFSTWPLYAPLYAKRGALFGWVTHTNVVAISDLDAPLHWSKPVSPGDAFYPQGFEDDIFMVGSEYHPPPPGSGVLVLPNTSDNAKLTFGEGNLALPIIELITISPDNSVTSTNVTLKFTTKTGLFSGTFTLPGTAGTATFRGAVLQKQNFGSGFFFGVDETGFVTIEPSLP